MKPAEKTTNGAGAEEPRRPRRRLRPGALPFRPDMTRFQDSAVGGAAPAPAPAPSEDARKPRPRTMLTCHGPHPGLAKGKYQYAGRAVHGREIMPVPFFAVHTGRVLSTFDQVDNEAGCMGARCPSSDCKLVTEYRIVAHAGCQGDEGCSVCQAIAAGHAAAVPLRQVA